MRTLTTIICALCFAVAGTSLALTNYNPTDNSYNTASAALIPKWDVSNIHKSGLLPLDLQLDLEKKYKENHVCEPEIVHDTVYVEQKVKYKRKRVDSSTIPRAVDKRLGDSIPAILPDTLLNSVDTVREEYTVDTIGPPKVSIILIVDGKEVYKR